MAKEKIVVNKNLRELRASGYEMAKGEPDIRGWKVLNNSNQEIGKVKEVLFDVAHQKVRYVIADLDGKPINLQSRDVVIPVGLAELDATENVVYFPDVTVGHLATLPEYKKGKITYRMERQIRDVFIPQDSAAADKLAEIEASEYPEREAFYNSDYFDDKRMYKRRKENKIRERVYEDDAYKPKTEKYVATPDDLKNINAEKNTEEIIYIPDDKDPSILRRTRVVREAPDNKKL
ncbi:MAG: PRC-barrel domain-containing protein [Ginsengibacter sp.]